MMNDSVFKIKIEKLKGIGAISMEKNTPYTLMEHLKYLSEKNEDFKSLYSSWNIDYGVIKDAISCINMNFPHYSKHDESHSKTILRNVEMILGEDRIKELSQTDKWMLIICSYIHDIGMVYFNSEINEVWKSDEFRRYLYNLKDKNEDKDLKEASIRIVELEEILKKSKIEISESIYGVTPLKIRADITLLLADYFRPKHGKRSMSFTQNKDIRNSFGYLISKSIPERLKSLVGDICLCHSCDFKEMMDKLKEESDGIGTDKVHPRFIASMLRLGDLLDLDDGRFNEFQRQIFGKNHSHISNVHEKKHASIRHLLISPEIIEIEADCENHEVYRETRRWFAWIEKELENLSSRWADIVPKDISGKPLKKGKIKVFLEGEQDRYEQHDLKFKISNEKAFEIIEGSSIYNSKYVFVREVIQNAMDASKIQMWLDIKSGMYDFLFKTKKLGDLELEYEKYLEILKSEDYDSSFPFYIPNQIYDNYKISIKLEKRINKDTKKAKIIFKIEDNGVGISCDRVKKIACVGERWKKDDKYRNVIESMPYFLKPTASFGLGLQSIFMLTDKFEILTKSEGEDLKKIVFENARESNGYISIIKKLLEHDINNFNKRRNGSIVVIEIEENYSDESLDFECENLLNIKEKIKNYVGKNFILQENEVDDKELENEIITIYKPVIINNNLSYIIERKEYVELVKEKELSIFAEIENNKLYVYIYDCKYEFCMKLSFINEKSGSIIKYRSIDVLNKYFNIVYSISGIVPWVELDILSSQAKEYLFMSRDEFKDSYVYGKYSELINNRFREIVSLLWEKIYDKLESKFKNIEANQKMIFYLFIIENLKFNKLKKYIGDIKEKIRNIEDSYNMTICEFLNYKYLKISELLEKDIIFGKQFSREQYVKKQNYNNIMYLEDYNFVIDSNKIKKYGSLRLHKFIKTIYKEYPIKLCKSKPIYSYLINSLNTNYKENFNEKNIIDGILTRIILNYNKYDTEERYLLINDNLIKNFYDKEKNMNI